MSWGMVADVASAICLLGGALLAFAAGVGLVRFPELLARMHSATKPQVLGLILVLIGLALRLRSGPAVWMLALVAVFQLLTSPVASHMVGRAGYRTGKVRSELLVVDDLTADQAAATHEQRKADQQAPDQQAPDQRAPDQPAPGQPAAVDSPDSLRPDHPRSTPDSE